MLSYITIILYDLALLLAIIASVYWMYTNRKVNKMRKEIIERMNKEKNSQEKVGSSRG